MDPCHRINYRLYTLGILAQYHNVSVNPEEIKHRFNTDGTGLGLTSWLLAAKSSELKVKQVKRTINRLGFTPLSALVRREDGRHFISTKVSKEANRYPILDLEQRNPCVLEQSEFKTLYQGHIILIASRSSVTGKLAKFDFTWFIPTIIKYRKAFIETLVVSIFLQLFTSITPLFFQVIMDKVLVHRGFSTLNVITVVLSIMVVFEIILSGLRTYILAYSTSRVDAELDAKLFRYLLALPVSYFESRRVDDIVTRVRELNQIRNFLIGQALASVLNLLFSFIFPTVIWHYNSKLTLVILLLLPCYVVWSVFINPVLRCHLDDKFSRNTDNQSFLVESITVVNTIKAMAVSPQVTSIWDKQLAGYVAAGFKVAVLATIGQQEIQLVQKTVIIINLWLGARLATSGDLSIGQLIAFNILAGQIVTPVIRLIQIWQDFQQVGISVTRPGDVLNSPTENYHGRLALPKIDGDITFRDIRSRYKPDSPVILDSTNLSVKQREVIGIIGRSGSGESILTKLIQRFYIPGSGQVLIDRHDLALADPNRLRCQVGAMLQDNVLLNRNTIDNISLASPGMSVEKIICVVKLAGVHDFISKLREGYNTTVGEQGAGLSGGQRQHIIIVRTLVNSLKILIFDEAASALDYESEHVIMRNTHKTCKGRMAIIIAHRLSTVKDADRTIVMKKGKIVEQSKHKGLLSEPESLYNYLYQLQSN